VPSATRNAPAGSLGQPGRAALLQLDPAQLPVALDGPLSVNRELMLVKVRADAATRGQVLDAVQLFRAKVVDVAPDAVTIEVTGNGDKLADFREVLEPFGIRELVQSGMVAIGRGSRSISERTPRPIAVPTAVRS